ncbi:MAG: hypothetical protein KGI54_08795 [Pseudomonadota bacterium]|nr:hypothetical protein [Pseudomonadota bacterium]
MKDFEALLEAIEMGKFTPDEMECIVNAMHYAYSNHHANILSLMAKTPEDYAIEMFEARESINEPCEFDICPDCNGSGEGQYDGAACRTCGGRGNEWSKK